MAGLPASGCIGLSRCYVVFSGVEGKAAAVVRDEIYGHVLYRIRIPALSCRSCWPVAEIRTIIAVESRRT